jgi:hypothetical protein
MFFSLVHPDAAKENQYRKEADVNPFVEVYFVQPIFFGECGTRKGEEKCAKDEPRESQEKISIRRLHFFLQY